MIYKLKPILKHRLWGGKLLPQIYESKTSDTIGEAWILSCIGNDNSQLENGQTLLDLFNKNPNIVAQGFKGPFPLLIKLIDAQDDLSIQVHPSSKTEFWHILNEKPSKLYIGFNQNVDKQQVKQALDQGKITSLLNNVDVVAEDSYLINPRTVHAIGKKTFLIEIQQSADTTYRLFDFNRIDKNGKHRDLHISQALDCLDYNQYSLEKKNKNDHLINCPFFNVYKYKIFDNVTLNASKSSFHAIIVLEGSGQIKSDKKSVIFKAYDTFFIPANTSEYEISGNSTVIVVTL